MTGVVVAICLIIVGFRLFTGGQRIALCAAVVVGAFVGFAGELAHQGVSVLGSILGALSKIGGGM